MLISISTTLSPATDLGYLLHKNPHNIHESNLPWGKAYVFYSQASEELCTANLLVDINSVDLIRKGKKRHVKDFSLYHYINDRPYAASSFISVAISRVFGDALKGKCKAKPHLTELAIPLKVTLTALPSRRGAELLEALFQPLGYEIKIKPLELNQKFPEWGASPYFEITLIKTCPLKDLLAQLYVLIPVLDDNKHYWVNEAEIEKLLQYATDWLPDHPQKTLITSSYLAKQRSLTDAALARLTEEDTIDVEQDERKKATMEESIEQKINLNQQRLDSIADTLNELDVKTIIDLGCGEGKLIKRLIEEKKYTKITGVDVAHSELCRAEKKLKFKDMHHESKQKVNLLQSSLMYRDKRFENYDAATLIEVIEHVELSRLDMLEKSVFQYAQPKYVIVTTPNVEYNTKFEALPSNTFRHKDHRFEWTREEFQSWANHIGKKFGYFATFKDIGTIDEKVGSPTQMAIFTKQERESTHE